MELSQPSTMDIVTEISKIIGQHVNMMDEKGYIIASTDQKRIGTFHGGAAALIESGQDLLVIDHNGQFKGARKGINLPLMLEERLVGVIGITGAYKEVMKYGQIIKKMTEAMLKENFQKEQKKIDSRIQSRFLDEWILDGVPVTTGFAERGARLNIDVQQSYRVMVAVLADFRQFSDTAKGQMMIDKINRYVRQLIEESGGIFTKTATKMICLCPGKMLSDDHAVSYSKKLIQLVKLELNVELQIGIDGQGDSINLRYQQASKAVQGCMSRKKSICLYEDISFEIFLDEISIASRQAFIRRMFRDCSEREIEQAVAVMQVYFDQNGSVKKAAEQLFMHKNTLQYKLKRIYEKTGCDPRTVNGSALFCLAIQFYLAAQS